MTDFSYNDFGEDGYTLVAIKREWVPEWLWSLFCADLWLLPKGIAAYQPLRVILTKKIAS